MKVGSLLIGILLLACIAQARASDDDEWKDVRPMVVAAVDVDATGHVTHAEAIGDSRLPQLNALIQQTVRNWRFEPASLDGTPVTAKTYVELAPQMRQHDGQIELRLSYESHGAGMLPKKYPAFPHLVMDADVLMGATVQADGTYGDIHVISARTSDGARGAAFYKYATETLRQSRALPEEVNGRPVLTHIQHTFHFTVRPVSGPDAAYYLQRMKIASDSPSPDMQETRDRSGNFVDALITLDSPLKLVSTN